VADITITVHGHPWPEGSLKIVTIAGHPRIIPDNPKALQAWRDAVAWQAKAARSTFLRQPVAVEMTLWLPRPKSHYRTGASTAHLLAASAPRYPGGARWDVDKLARAVLDSIAGVLFGDDAQVADLTARKRYAPHGTLPGARIRIREME